MTIDAKRRSSPTLKRGDPQSPHSVAASTGERQTTRVLALKVEIDWRREESKALYTRLRDLGWMAAHYRNQISHIEPRRITARLTYSVSSTSEICRNKR